MEDNILSNIHEKIESGFYLDKINIDGKFEILKQEEKCLVLFCCDGKSDVGIAVRLPLPLRFDEEWFNPIQTGLFWSICDLGGAPRTPPLYLWNQ